MSGAAIRLERCGKTFADGTRALEPVDLEFAAGETVVLLGPSGCGKSTLLHLLGGLDKPSEGHVIIGGHNLSDLNDDQLTELRRRKIGFVFQGYFLLPELTALENVLLPTMIGGKADQERGVAALERVGLKERLHHLPAELSGGEQQRVAIARALINDPAVVFADEPTGNLDSKTGDDIVQLLFSLVRESGKTLVVVTHDAELAKRGERRLEMRDGMVVGDVSF